MNYTTVSKIEEMAHRDLPVKSLVVGGVMFDENEAERIGYMLGAKAVLEEIEKFIAELPCKSDEELLNQKMLWQRIKQLKEK